MELAPKDPDTAATYTIDWRDQLIGEALRKTEFALGAVVRAQRHTGFYYEMTETVPAGKTFGETKSTYPTWPRAAGETVVDGSIVWTARHREDVTVALVQSAVWTVPAGLTIDSQAQVGTRTDITVSGGVDGEDYELTCRMTPTSGAVLEQTITIPVRHQ